MKIYLVRHGQANSADIDPQKGLSNLGHAEIKQLAESIKHLNISVDEIWHSGKARACQTAEILASVVKSSKELIEKSGLNPNDNVKKVAEEIKAYNVNLMIVGHLPFMAKLSSLLITGNENRSAFEFDAGALACFDYNKGSFCLSWLIHPGLIKPEKHDTFQSYH